MGENQIISDMRRCLNCIETVKNQYLLLSSMTKNNDIDALLDNCEMPALLYTWIQQLKVDIKETEIVNNLSSYLRKVEMERNQLQMENQRLELENVYLKEDLHDTQQKFRISEKAVAQLEEENKHLQFLLSLTMHEDNDKGIVTIMETDDDKLKDRKTLHNTTFHNEDDFQSNSTDLINLSPLKAEKQKNEISVELISQRLKALHSVISQQGCQNNDEMACKGNVEEIYIYKRTHIAAMLNIIALIHRDLCNYEEAAQLLNEVLELRLDHYGEHHIGIVVILNTLAKLYDKCDMDEAAEAANRKALRIKEEIRQRNDLQSMTSQAGQTDQLSYEIFTEQNQEHLNPINNTRLQLLSTEITKSSTRS
ncbi:kinesin light chain-like [Glossina fuscipes]|uniref:Kinesin light chain-like n=1 Tax=Glossina fuscipes TaxID=7396 RepID=A0A9C5YXB2_9MUSC|nr:kinesin light chain-like [Glossina fuscipes]